MKNSYYKYAVSTEVVFTLDQLNEPNEMQSELFEIAIEKIEYSGKPVCLLIDKVKWGGSVYAGMACKLSNDPDRMPKDTPYCIVISSYVFEEYLEYIMYVLMHELRHCEKENGIFRWHDYELTDLGWKEKGFDKRIGFFNEEFREMGCCDTLLWYFKACDGIEAYI